MRSLSTSVLTVLLLGAGVVSGYMIWRSTGLRGTVEEHDTRIGGVEKKTAEHDETLIRHDSRLTETEGEVEVQGEKIADHEVEIEQHSERIDQVASQVAEVANQVREAETRLETTETRLKDAEERLTAAEKRADQDDQALAEMKSLVEKLRKEQGLVQRDLASHAKRVRELEKELGDQARLREEFNRRLLLIEEKIGVEKLEP